MGTLIENNICNLTPLYSVIRHKIGFPRLENPLFSTFVIQQRIIATLKTITENNF